MTVVAVAATVDAADPAPSDAVVIIEQMHALADRLQNADLSRLSDVEVGQVAAENERLIARLAYAGNQQIVEVENRNIARKTGHRSIIQYMQHRLRIAFPGRRHAEVKATATYTDLTTGQPLEPELPTLARELADGRVGSAHVHAVMDVVDQIPHAVPHDVRAAAEQTLAEYAATLTPAEIGQVGARLLAHLDPDGTLTDHDDRARRRNLQVNRQRADGTSKLIANLTPLARARVMTFLAVWARPGMNNPTDPESPCGSIEDADPEVVAAAADRDHRTPAQRNHDALNALLEAVFDDGMLGKTHRGLPVQLIAKAELADLIRETGFATSADGTLIPIADLIAIGADVQPWLAVFKDATAVPLYFGRGKRLGTMEQRLVSFARPDGEMCSSPDCDMPTAHVEMHHAHTDWGDGGFTDIDNLTPACTRHHHMVGDQPGQYSTRMIADGSDEGRCSWQLNAEPGAPPNPERINRRPDMARRFNEVLTDIRDEIHGQPEPLSVDAPRPQLRQVIDLQEASPAELAIASVLLNTAYRK
ncbi:DUF222 domain-containing protein [Gordonia rubripertincta]|uniref:DUF222 domain-containing protein n=2 Tax=Gordonia rubripertincta TaxID=36822 RepID=A0AAW6REZ2_GORRU|nr:HNH endonuclease signature motif containing protein [Gordonia rubripertincta]ASR02908.1 hypothetical protein GCWB2_10555 [Gordonia rubripertincta]MBM7279212.1 DUF222 domain-containing protein [Gordonia rubripertincta]MDG6782562.1 DUF222 domain-containing protein [Gordonia rubripertincta]NKY64762.1 DUF222 domain-containing protein [Gordonia rubripertincta]GAB86533.1 hypothetical protein GORBP_075_00350 [Gordonia rubripertincta NBRC 101908]